MSVRFIPLANINGKPGAKGDKGDTGTFAGATAVSVPAGDPAEVSLSGPESAKVANFKIPRGLPGVNALENDAAVAAYIAATDSDTRSALEGVFIQKDALVFNAADHGVVGDGTADDTATMQALIDQVPDGATIVAPPGAVYRTDGWEVQSRNLTLDLSNAELVKTSESEILRGVGHFDAPVSAAVQETLVSSSLISVVDTSGFVNGSVVKVISDDPIPDARPHRETGALAYQGQFALVLSVDSGAGTIKVTPPLLDEYVTNVRVVRLETANRVDFRFGTARAETPNGTPFGNPMFAFESLANSSISGHVLNAPALAFADRSCFYTNADLRTENLQDEDGYGIICAGSQGGQYRIIANRGRHAFTDEVARRMMLGESNDPRDYGRSMWATITGRSDGSMNNAFDTHHGGYGHLFRDIIVTSTQSGTCLRFRGQHHTASNVHVYNSQSGFEVMEEESEPWSYSHGHRLIGCSATNVWTPVNMNGLTTRRANTHLTIEGGVFEFMRAWRIERSVVTFNDPVFRYTRDAAPTSAFIQSHISRLRGRFTLEAEDVLDAPPESLLAATTTSPNEIDVDVSLYLSDSIRASSIAVMSWGGGVGQVRARLFGPHSLVETVNRTLDADEQSIIMKTIGGAGSSRVSAYLHQTPPGDNREILMFSGDPIVARAIGTPGGTVTMGRIWPGAFQGQVMVLYAHKDTTQVTIQHGGVYNTALAGGTNKTLGPWESLRLVWDGTYWVETA